MSGSRLSPILDRLLVVLFVVAISAPLVGTVAGIGDEETAEENREAASWPAVPRSRSALAAWPDAFTKSFADHFAFRSPLVQWQARARVGLLRTSPAADVMLGDEGWLFYNSDGALQDYTGAQPFSADELERWRATLQHTQDWLERRGIQYVFVFAPDKHWIYPEHMPGGLNRPIHESRYDQLVEHLRRSSTVNVVDARDGLRASASGERLYHRTDTHWNDRGAFVTYQQVMATIGPRLDVQARTPADMESRTIPRTGFDLARMLGLGSVLVEEDLQLEPRSGRRSRVIEPARPSRGLMDARVVTEGPPAGPRAVVFRDSFGSAMIPYLSEHFSRAMYVWQNNFDPALIEAERPDVVIQEWVGRHLYTATPYDAVAASAATFSSSDLERR